MYRSRRLKNPLLVVLAVEVPLNDSGAIFPRVFTNIECFSTKGKDYIFSTIQIYLLEPVFLISLVGGRLLDENSSILIRTVGDCQEQSALSVLQHNLELAVNYRELLVLAVVVLVDDELSFVGGVLADVKHFPSCNRFEGVILFWLSVVGRDAHQLYLCE